MTARLRHGWLAVALVIWTMLPLLTLLLRTTAASWRYPALVPDNILAAPFSSSEFRRVGEGLLTSLALASATGPVAAALGFLIARPLIRASRTTRTIATATALFPVVAPPVALGIGLQVLALESGLSGTVTGVWLAHLVPATGYLTLFALAVLSAHDLGIEDEARTLGASQGQVLMRVTVPLLAPRIVEGSVLGALVSWGQLALSLVIGGGLVRTLPIELLSLVGSGNDQHGALAALLLTIPPAVGLGLLQLAVRRTGAAW